MKIFLYIFPVAILVAYSQIVLKWRLTKINFLDREYLNFYHKLFVYLSDPYILSGYLIAMLGSFLWLFVITKIQLSIGFPVYVGVTFLIVLLGSWFILDEQITLIRLISIFIILLGIVLGLSEQ